jgi:hypothetical protein
MLQRRPDRRKLRIVTAQGWLERPGILRIPAIFAAVDWHRVMKVVEFEFLG